MAAQTASIKIVDHRGRPMGDAPKRRYSALSGGSNVPFDAADYANPHLREWNPYLGSADQEINPYRDRIVSRVRDLVRNDGWANGAVTRILDSTIGASFRPISKPDYRALAAHTGNKAFDAKWADEFGRALDASWRNWAEGYGMWGDAQRSMTVNQIFRVAFRHKLVDGDALAQMVYLPERVGYGRARYGTAVNLIDPDRLSNPNNVFDLKSVRGGVQIDEIGAAIGYHIRQAHQGDWFNVAQSLTWEYHERETQWGYPVIIHDYDRTRASEHRGAGGIFAPILDRFRMLAKYDRTELDAAIINATFAAYIESPMDPQLVQQAMDDEDGFDLNHYQQVRADYHGNRKTMVGEARMLSLVPGEKVGVIDAARPNSNFASFESAFVRNFASAVGLTEQQFSQDWRGVNYSSARAAILDVWKTLIRRRRDFGSNFAAPIRVAACEEFFEVDDLPLPRNAPDFVECRAMYAMCKWAGPGRGWVDPVADREGANIGISTGLTTLEHETLENSGEDWEEILDQRKLEVEGFKSRGLPVPEWSGIVSPMTSPNKSGSHDPSSPNYRSNPDTEK